MNKPFLFKEFTVQQDKCAMKIGTDGVLLGSWASVEKQPETILDIGAGTGIIALQLAQRTEAEIIDAIEIDDNAYEQCVENFEDSLWSDRLFCYHTSLKEFTQEVDDKYDLIVSNPPFYNDNFETENIPRNKARFTSSLSFETLTISVNKLLSQDGIFSLILPFKEEEKFMKIASREKLYINRICHVKGNQYSEIKRSLLEFSFNNKTPIKEALTIEKERHVYTPEYIDLVKDFYLKM